MVDQAFAWLSSRTIRAISSIVGARKSVTRVVYRDRTRQWWTTGRLADLALRPDTPVTVLLSERTFSSGEALAYHIQSQGRGQLVGERRGVAMRHEESRLSVAHRLDQAGRQPASVYRASVLYTTLSPCDMCTGAILLYGIPRVVIGENRTFRGPEDYVRSRGVELIVVDNDECVRLMREFIAAHSALWNEDIGV